MLGVLVFFPGTSGASRDAIFIVWLGVRFRNVPVRRTNPPTRVPSLPFRATQVFGLTQFLTFQEPLMYQVHPFVRQEDKLHVNHPSIGSNVKFLPFPAVAFGERFECRFIASTC